MKVIGKASGVVWSRASVAATAHPRSSQRPKVPAPDGIAAPADVASQSRSAHGSGPTTIPKPRARAVPARQRGAGTVGGTSVKWSRKHAGIARNVSTSTHSWRRQASPRKRTGDPSLDACPFGDGRASRTDHGRRAWRGRSRATRRPRRWRVPATAVPVASGPARVCAAQRCPDRASCEGQRAW